MKLRHYFFLFICVWHFFYTSSLVYAFVQNGLPPGVVATVNGTTILLEDVEALHDTTGNILVFQEKPEVQSLQEQYSNSLYTLIVYTLMLQELEKLGYHVTEKEIMQAEEEVKQDYLGEDFEKSLQEEYLDLNTWRKLMKQRLVYQKFQKHVLRPQIVLSYEDIEAYYNEHYNEFFIPEKVEIIWFQDTNSQNISCQDTLISGAKQPKEGELMLVDINRLPEKMRADLMKINPGECTPCRKEGEVFQCALLKNRYLKHQASIVEAYPRIELILLEDKLEKAYSDWLEKMLSNAKICVRPQFQLQRLYNK